MDLIALWRSSVATSWRRRTKSGVLPGRIKASRAALGCAVGFASVLSESECSAADQDERAQADQDCREQDVFPAL